MPVRCRAVPRLDHRLKDLPAERKADYGELVAPYLRRMDDDIRRAARGLPRQRASSTSSLESNLRLVVSIARNYRNQGLPFLT